MASRSAIAIHPPFEGRWKALRPPGHHPDAVDFVRLDESGQSTHTGSRLAFVLGRIPSTSYLCWDQPVYAPIDGVVIRVGDGWDDHQTTGLWSTISIWYNATFRFRPKEEGGRLDIRPNAGNHVMIQAKEGFVVLLAHLRKGSVAVAEGMEVQRGTLLGRVGNSGNSTMPHLHLNLFDQMDDPFTAKVLPFVFDRYEVLDRKRGWSEQRSTCPSAGEVVRFQC